MRNNLLSFVIIFLFYSSLSLAAGGDDLTLGAGTLTNYVGKVQTDKEGHTRKFEFSPFFSASLKWYIYDKFSLIPEIGMGLPEKSEDRNIDRFHYQFLVNIGYDHQNLTTKLGLGFAFTRLTSDGGEERLENGLGYTNFHLPSFTSTSRNLILNLGADYIIYQDWAAHIRIISYNITNQYKRAFSYFIGFNYHFGKWDWIL